jgi:sulfoxide reductase heme-binding subunit YedZ
MRNKIIGFFAVSLGLSLSVVLAHPAFAVVTDTAITTATPKANTIIVQTIPGPTVAQKLTSRARTSWPWYVARGSGLIAAVALTILMLSGIGLVTGFTFRFLEPLTAWASHRALGLTFGIAVLIHIVSLLFDTFVPFSLLQLLVPWLSSYRPVVLAGVNLGSLYVAMGVLALYGVAVVIITSLLWVDKKQHRWKLLHYLSYFIILLVFVHALYLGTDLARGFARWLWIAVGIGITAGVVSRLWRARTL